MEEIIMEISNNDNEIEKNNVDNSTVMVNKWKE